MKIYPAVWVMSHMILTFVNFEQITLTGTHKVKKCRSCCILKFRPYDFNTKLKCYTFEVRFLEIY